MAYIVVGILVWIAAAIAIAFVIGKAIKIADDHEGGGSRARLPMALEHTATRA